MKHTAVHYLCLLLSVIASLACNHHLFVESKVLRAALIGDYGRLVPDLKKGYNITAEVAVSEFVKSWEPEFIVTSGDNNYNVGSNETIDENIGSCYSEWISEFRGDRNKYPSTSSSSSSSTVSNRFFPVLGNHDGYTSMFGVTAWPYLNYFAGVKEMKNESENNNQLLLARRYYDFVRGPIHFLMLNSNPWEPDGISADSVQGEWAKKKLKESTSPHRIIVWHHLAYSNNLHDLMTPALRWPFKEWGASVVISGHAHCYERIEVDDFTYLVNGLGGTVPIYPTRQPGDNFPIKGTKVWFNTTWGAQLIEADEDTMNITFTSLPSLDSYSQHSGFFMDKVQFTAVHGIKEGGINSLLTWENEKAVLMVIVGIVLGMLISRFVTPTQSKNDQQKGSATAFGSGTGEQRRPENLAERTEPPQEMDQKEEEALSPCN